MNEKVAKKLRKISKKMSIDYVDVKFLFKKLDKEKQQSFIKKWIKVSQ